MQLTSKEKLTDTEVIHHYLNTRDPFYFSILYDRYAKKVFAKCISILNDYAHAEDALQEIFTKIFLNISKFGEQSKFSTWVYSITYNYCIDLVRKKKKSGALFSDEMEKVPDLADDISDEEILSMEIERLRVILEKIPIGDKAILLMKYNDDMSILEIAEVLQKSESAVKMKIMRAKEKARLIYQDLYADK